ncbi:GspH/FimT family pseudopilin [Rubrivivax gelatinosus]|uniref:Type II secretion system protein H n=1 Tax=Rubrivivax gelatinosus (strain NBRC 100245 / IL144) TaxID=983917 RepID=I0HXM5_RUBGI|nr:GspH/FimT family pseudopilin [Rubrivivax gelatinosus]MBG6079694.1 type IV fimbrial biogenesis protein FimT [Rubrivivax gelatinosus]BAL97762.1 type IV pilus transmembrane FimT-like protein [Rubrivivax gelatinosus IL144]
MRHLKRRGLTLIELMVALAIGAMLMLAAAPHFAEFVSNSRLREAGNVLYTQALYAQSEALKRNGTVRLGIDGSTVTVTDVGGNTTLRTVTLSGSVAASEAKTISFNGRGMIAADASIDLGLPDQTCSADLRCPGLRVEGGGAIRLCGDNTGTC